MHVCVYVYKTKETDIHKNEVCIHMLNFTSKKKLLASEVRILKGLSTRMDHSIIIFKITAQKSL